MPTCEAWDVVKVPFPYTDRPVRQRRPALVVSTGALEDRHGLLWVLMITSAANRGWPSDVAIVDLALAGLPVPSVVRTAKIATIDASMAERLGTLGRPERLEVSRHLTAHLPGTAAPATR